MIISYKWLCDYLPKPIPIAELSTILTSIGLEVEAVEPVEKIKGNLKDLVIGEILTCVKHPNADKLNCTTVAINENEILKIVCGAPNVGVGQKVVVAPVGSTCYPTHGDAFEIKKAKIRGEESEGMICGADEIGLSEERTGIINLPEHAIIGTLASDFYQIPEVDYAIHIGLTPNRSDANSHLGVARDVCAYLTHHSGEIHQVVLPENNWSTPNNLDAPLISIAIENKTACPRYIGAEINKTKVGPSPDWLVQRLKTIGVRSINNIVDVTNFVLHEYGQPLHAFDADQIAGQKIIIKNLPQDTPFISLDQRERKLNSEDLMICDAAKGLCMAGVFGGLNSGVTEHTQNIFLESAYFNPTTIRRTSIFHQLRTDAAIHFEKGVDYNNVMPALKRALQLIQATAGGQLAAPITAIEAQSFSPKTISITYQYINQLSGKNYDSTDIKNILIALGFKILTESEQDLNLEVPSNKIDVLLPADIVEEIVRIDGLDQIEIPSQLNISLIQPIKSERALQNKIAHSLVGLGFSEIITNSIVNSRHYEGRTDLVKMLNSLNSELDVMRPQMLESGLEIMAYNINRKNNNLLLFDFGNIYKKINDRYEETAQLALYTCGHIQPNSWNAPAQKSSIFSLKGVIQKLLTTVGLAKIKEIATDNKITWSTPKNQIAEIQIVDPKILKIFDLNKIEICHGVINWKALYTETQNSTIKYKEWSKYPAVQRDLALVVDLNTTFQDIKKSTQSLNLSTLKSFHLFDYYIGDKIEKGKKSLALNYTFQSLERTLTDNEVEEMTSKLRAIYQKDFNAEIRE